MRACVEKMDVLGWNNSKPVSGRVIECQVPFHVKPLWKWCHGKWRGKKLIGDASRKKQENNREDNRDLITIVWVGNAACNSGPMILLASGKKLESKALKNLDRKDHPPGHTFTITPIAYMTNMACIQLVPVICKGIRTMPVICDHPYWWVMLSLDEYYSHINMHD